MENKQKRKDWEQKFVNRLKAGGMSGLAAQALFHEIYGIGRKIDLGEEPEQAAKRILLKRLSGKG